MKQPQKPAVGGSGNPTLNKKPIADFVTDDMKRIAEMGADPLGFNPSVNKPLDPAARSYQAQIQARRAASALKGKSPPLGGAPMPDSDKMHAIAGLSGGGMAQPSFLEPTQLDPEAPPPEPRRQPTGGVGSAFPVNQGVSQGLVNGPVPLQEATSTTPPNRRFSSGTEQALSMAHENVQQAQAQRPTQEAPPQPQSVAQQTSRELDEVEGEFEPEGNDEFEDPPVTEDQLRAIKEAREPLMDPERRKDIESRLRPLKIGDMIAKQELVQRIPIIAGEYEIDIRTVSQQENLWILRYIYDFPGSVLYTQELINTCRLVCGLLTINGAHFPEHRKNPGTSSEEIDKEMFEKKMRTVARYPVQLVADVSIQQIWFQERVNKLFTVKSLKNG